MKPVASDKPTPLSVTIILLSFFLFAILGGCVSAVQRTNELQFSETTQESTAETDLHVISLQTQTWKLSQDFDFQKQVDTLENMSVLASLGTDKLLLIDSEGEDLFTFMIETNHIEALDLVSDNSIVLDAIAYGDWIVWLEQDRGSSGAFSADFGWRIMRFSRSKPEIRQIAEFTGMPGDPELIGLGDAVLPHSLTLTDEGAVAGVFNIVPAYLDRYSFSVLVADKAQINQASDLPAAVILFGETEDEATMTEQVLDLLDDQRGRTFGSLQYNQDHLTWLWIPTPASLQSDTPDPAAASQSEANFLKVYDLKSAQTQSIHLPGAAMSAAWIENRLLVIPLASGTPVPNDKWVSGTVLQYDTNGNWSTARWLEEALATSIKGLPPTPEPPPYRIITMDHYLTFTGLNLLILIDMEKEICYHVLPDADTPIHNPKVINCGTDAAIIAYQTIDNQEISTHSILAPLP